jgi:malonate transporter
MSALVSVVLPIFALILAGYGARRFNLLGSNATSELNRFVVYLALPALLFQIVATAHWQELWQPGFIASFGLSTLLLFVLATVWQCRRGRPLADATLDGLCVSYANTGFMGIPLCLLAFGRDGSAPAIVATIAVVCALFAVALVMVEIDLNSGQKTSLTLWKAGKSLLRNPLLIAPVLGAAWAASGVSLPAGIEHFTELLGGAASPCALITLGLFLAQPRSGRTDRTALMLTAVKLLAAPILTAWLAFSVFSMPPQWARAAVLLAALPTGTGPFMLAEFYRREADVTSRVILLSTILSIGSVWFCLTKFAS